MVCFGGKVYACDTKGLVWVNLDTGVFVSRLTPDSDRQLEHWNINIYGIVASIYIVMRCVLSISSGHLTATYM